MDPTVQPRRDRAVASPPAARAVDPVVRNGRADASECPRCGGAGLLMIGTTRYSIIFRCQSCEWVAVERRS